jgi:hypothetical protein
MTFPRAVLLLCSLSAVGLGCGNDYSDKRCDDIINQIHASLEDNVNKGILVPEAIACGDDGVANRMDSFNARASQSDVEYLQSAFQSACDEYQDHC